MDLKNTLKFLKLNESALSMVFGAALVLAVVFLGANYFRNRAQTQPSISNQAPQTTNQTSTSTEEGKVPTNLPNTHKVEKGEHLWGIAEKYYGSGYNWVDIANANELKHPGQIEIGQELKIPEVQAKKITLATIKTDATNTFGPAIQGDIYTVEKGDHLWGIAVRAYGDGYQWVKIAQTNEVKNPDLIEIGQVLKLPRGEISQAPASK
ncbi:MAG: LysM peptidoglycan-binding domain-containing protein [Candidatus Blackburnbacteria bacterium]|nr:LysM peptidoglycan-binding domain-containing protein [Candidatus Blackburnbacteria bacterium]